MDDFRSILGNLQVSASALRMNASALERQAASLETYAQRLIDAIDSGANGLTFGQSKSQSKDGMDSSPNEMDHGPNGLDTLSLSSEAASGRQNEAEKAESESGSSASSAAVQSARERESKPLSKQMDHGPNGSPKRTHRDGGGLPRQMAAAWDGVDGLTVSGTNRGRIAACEPLLRRLAVEQGEDPIGLWRAAVKRFKADPGIRKNRLGLNTFLSQLESWCWPDVAPEKTAGEIRADQSAAELARQQAEDAKQRAEGAYLKPEEIAALAGSVARRRAMP